MTMHRRALVLTSLVATACGDGGNLGGDCSLVRVTDDSAASLSPSLAWSGSEYGLAWGEEVDILDYAIHFVRLDEAGAPLGDVVQVAAGSHPQLVWNGDGYGISWSEGDTVHFALLDAAGTTTSSDSFSGAFPSLIWTGSEYGIAYAVPSAPDASVHLQRFGGQGEDLGSQQVSSATTRARFTAIAWNDSQYGVAWSGSANDPPGMFFAAVHPTDGVGPEVALGDGVGPALASEGGPFALTRIRESQVYFTGLAADGSPLGEDLPLTPETSFLGRTRVVWNGAGYGILWHVLAGPDSRIEHTEVVDGVAGPVLRVGDAAELSPGPSLVWNGSSYAAAWGGLPYGAPDIYFSCVL
jgi:hypothetical protein